ncbi:hypothetical protein TL16_g11241 [Triparma laevis f. inornata]|uniref:Uncharacterized protein n=1 Tax=Triparma laevis f. inornata TaxID=1714386 RepID=A0A9W7EQ19_9STRA|nr:hypothetical protein TL16_g11241 [Triparma laevis f. inornata]
MQQHISSSTPETTSNIQSLTSQVERLESLNISSKLYEAEVNSRLRDEQEVWEQKMADVESKADEVQNVMFRVQDRNYELEKELEIERKTVQALQDQITHQHDMFLNILAKQKMKHVKEQDMLKAAEDRRINGRVLEELQGTIIENEALSEEVTSLRASMLQMSEVIEHLEYVNLEKDFEVKKSKRANNGNNNAKRASPINSVPGPPSPTKSSQLSSPALDATDRETKRHRRETQRKHSAKEKNKLEVKSFISSWFSDAEMELKDGKEVTERESDAIADAARRATQEHAAKQKKEAQAKKDLGIRERNAFVQAAKNLKSGPGKMVVALTKCENEIDYLRHKLEMYEERDAESKRLLEAAESTMMSMVKNVEAEAVSLVKLDIPPPDPNLSYKPYSGGGGYAAEGTLLELSERNSELERQKRTLLDMLGEYEQDTHATEEGGDNFFDFARLSLFSPSTEVNLRNELSMILGLGGEITDDDLLYETQLLARERESMLHELDEVKRQPRVTSPDFLLHDAEVAELVHAKEIQVKNERAREHSIGMNAAKLAAAHPPAPRPPSPLAAMDDVEDVMEVQVEKNTHRKHTVGHTQADAAVKELDRIEKLNEEEKVDLFHKKHGRKHTVAHTTAFNAVEKFHESDVDSDSYGSDFDDGSGDGEGGDTVEEVDFFTEAPVVNQPRLGLVVPPSPLAALQEAYVEYPEEVHHPNAKLLLHTTKIYDDPLNNPYKFVMTCQCLNFENSSGFVMYRIKSYDAEVGREMCMDVGEQELRHALKHDQISFTYDAENKAFQNAVLDRLKLIPGHDLNNDGFLNADDVQRDDLTFALVAEGRWKPVKVMIEVGEGGRKKRIREKQKETQRKAEMAKALQEHEKRFGGGQ